MNEKNEEILKILKRTYEDCLVSEEDLSALANRLNREIFVNEYRLINILTLVMEFEAEQRETGVRIDIGRDNIIFAELLDLLEINEKNADRLYESFLEYNDFVLFDFLLNRFRALLPDDRAKKVLEIGESTFDKFLVENYR